MHSNTPKNSEVDAYAYIKEELEKLGWNIKNPARVPEGEVYKQNEALYNDYLKACLGRDMPEAVVKLNDTEFWVIESKRDKSEIEKALDEAKNQYAHKINQSKHIKCILATGIAGNDIDGYTVVNQFLHNGEWETILFNGNAKDTLLSKEQAEYIKTNNTLDYKDFPDFPEEKYLSSAEKINEVLHNAGINKNSRAKFIAGLILSLSLGQDIDLRIENTSLLVKNINNLIETKLTEVNKSNFFPFIKLVLPPSEENHIKYRHAIIDTLNELQTLDIKNAMASGNDILGKFYEKFLKYGNGAKEIGIVLTPRHVTEFAVNVIDVGPTDYIFDPCCGTGGFLVSAFDHIRNIATSTQLDEFKNYHMFGIEQDDEVVALALVNMIFRGDGRNNMSEGNCFQKNIEKVVVDGGFSSGKYEKRDGKAPTSPVITKVLMNPPFALKKGDEKERNFISYAMSQMQSGGVLFAIVPISVMLERSGVTWRKELLKHNTLLSVVTFPEDLFYPVSVGTVGVFIKIGTPHKYESQKVYFARATTDGFKKKKGKRIEIKGSENKLQEVGNELRSFVANQNGKFEDVPEFKKICLLDPDDKAIELAPEGYIDSKTPSLQEIQKGVEEMIAESVAFKIRYRDKLKEVK
jgi:type I restriction-modification system DNA methylase subunit